MRRARGKALKGPLAIVDTETTGTSPLYGRVIEVAILRVEDGVVTGSFQSLVNPGRTIPAAIEAITGLTNEDLLDAPPFYAIAHDVQEMLSGAIFVAHNAAFDYGFLKSEFQRAGRSFKATCLCTVKLSRKLFPEFPRHDLSSIIERYRIDCPRRHRAMDDARAVYDFLMIARSREGDARLQEVVGSITSGSMPAELERAVVDALPECPGVYLFHGPDGKLLYVGKSTNIRRRVVSHFSGAHRASREMRLCEQIRHVEARPTVGELGALLLESRLIKELQPIHNRVARLKRKIIVLRRSITPEGYLTAVMHQVDAILREEIPEILTIFKHRKQAKDYLAEAAKVHGLCQKLLGVEQSDGCCFQYHLHRCHGACLGEEDPALYNARFQGAFTERRIKAWPYTSGILIDERSSTGVEGEAFLINHWCLVSTIRYGEDGSEDITPGADYFDYDSYKIILRFLSNSANRRKIRKVTPEEFARFSGRTTPVGMTDLSADYSLSA